MPSCIKLAEPASFWELVEENILKSSKKNMLFNYKRVGSEETSPQIIGPKWKQGFAKMELLKNISNSDV